MGKYSGNKSGEIIDFSRLRDDLMDEYGAQMVTFTGAMGYSDMCDAQCASEEDLLKMARIQGFDLEKYKQ